MYFKNVIMSFIFGLIFTSLTGCGLSPQKLALNQEVKLKDATVKILSLESASSLWSSKTGAILNAPKGKKYLILSYEIKANSDLNGPGVGLGIYKNDTEEGIAYENTELTGAYSSSDYLDEGFVSYVSDIKAGETKKRQQFYEVNEDAKGLKVRVGEKYSWANLHSMDVDTMAQAKKTVEVMPEMVAFLKMLDSQGENNSNALKQYAAESIDAGGSFSTITSAEVKAIMKKADMTCYVIKAKYGKNGFLETKYDVCWQNGKIVSIAEKR